MFDILLLIRIPWLDEPVIKIENFNGQINLHRECIDHYNPRTCEYSSEEKDRSLRINLYDEMPKYFFTVLKRFLQYNWMNNCTIFCNDNYHKFEFSNWRMSRYTDSVIYFEKDKGGA